MQKLEFFIVSLIVFYFIMEFFIPLLRGKNLFPSFRSDEKEISEKISDAEKKIDEVKEVQAEADKKLEEAKKVKEKSFKSFS